VALLLNYGIEPVVNEGVVGEISGDVPGAAARYVEEAAGGKAVALFTIAPAASPAYRVWAKPVIDPREVARAHGIMAAMGTLLGEEALARHVASAAWRRRCTSREDWRPWNALAR
jgi:neutral ceramidase